MELKRCSCCGKELPINDFWKRKNSKDGHQGYCKLCTKSKTSIYRENNPDKTREYSKKHWWKYREEKINRDRVRMNNRQKFLDTLKTPCVKCGEKRVWVIQFHHKDPSLKSFTICEGAKNHKSKIDVINEVKKCVCLCANCHKEFHYLYGIKPKEPVDDLDKYLKGGIDYGAI